MKILFIVTRNPDPRGQADQMTTWQAIDFLENKHNEVTTCVLEPTPAHHIFSWLIIIASSFLRGVPLQIGMYWSNRNKRAIAKVLASTPQFDRVYVHLLRGMVATTLIPERDIYLGMQISQGLNFSRISGELSFGIKKLLYRFEAALCARYEKKVASRVRKINLVGDADIKFLRLENLQTVTMIPHGIDLSFQQPERKEADLIFISHLKSAANQAACVFLVEQVMPLVIRERPDVTLSICGFNMPRSFQRFANKNIRVVGAVDDALVSIAKHRVALNPVRAAAGMQNKVLAGLAAGVPVITTRQSVAGMNLPYETCIQTELDSASFAAAIINVLENYPAESSLKAVQSRVQNEWSWDALHLDWSKSFLDVNVKTELS
jgi:glycosyltransferase involved in cell wall biosynthesis